MLWARGGGDRFQCACFGLVPLPPRLPPVPNLPPIATRLSPQAGNPDDPLARISDRDEDVPSIVFTKIGNRSLTLSPGNGIRCKGLRAS